MSDDLLYDIALTRIFMVGPRSARTLINNLGSAKAVFECDEEELRRIGNIGHYLADRSYRTEALKRAEAELEYIRQHNIRAVGIQDDEYPRRLSQCPDAPTVLYHTGHGKLHTDKMVAVVGTRKISSYGRDLTERLIADLAQSNPEITIISGLAYGVDIAAHRAALSHGLAIIGVVAHGLDMIYPSVHRHTAQEMCLKNGAVVTEYLTKTRPDPQNFVQRNRIIAGMADVVVVVESAIKGGSLLTAEAANDYNRDVMAFPGRVNDLTSAGCNALIRTDKAHLITSAADLITLMDWNQASPQAVQPTLFAEPLPPEQQKVADILKDGSQHINTIARAIDLPIQRTSALLTTMVFDDIIRQLPGDRYEIIGSF